jgi:hypothetical protein
MRQNKDDEAEFFAKYSANRKVHARPGGWRMT